MDWNEADFIGERTGHVQFGRQNDVAIRRNQRQQLMMKDMRWIQTDSAEGQKDEEVVRRRDEPSHAIHERKQDPCVEPCCNKMYRISSMACCA